MDAVLMLLNKKLIQSTKYETFQLDLASGKMGICIYFYILSRNDQSLEYKNIAEKLLDEVFESIGQVTTIDVKSGLSGIGLGIDYLIENNYVKGNINIILNDVDDIVFKNLLSSKYHDAVDLLSLNQILYYLCIRLEKQKKNSEQEYLFRELIIQTINNLYKRIDLKFYEEPYTYNIDYSLPQFLFVLSKIYNLDFYNYRLIKIIEELSYKILSTIPLLHSNRLYLLWAIVILNEQIKYTSWTKHIELLRGQIDLKRIINSEIRNKNIYVSNGLSSIYYFIHYLSDYFNQEELELIRSQIDSKVKSSDAWILLRDNTEYFNVHQGLFSGFPGVYALLCELN
uniref:hypothetical protein n=1 Tax=uncultured Dysgonomonas sp. TaxID=206096 RepID=UPI00261624C4|nr:hypothetical protein [uncultured Dysgonomonas sp.]